MAGRKRVAVHIPVLSIDSDVDHGQLSARHVRRHLAQAIGSELTRLYQGERGTSQQTGATPVDRLGGEVARAVVRHRKAGSVLDSTRPHIGRSRR